MAARPEYSEDKLQRFSRHVFGQACAQRDEIRRSLHQRRDEIIEKTKRQCELEASEARKRAQADLLRETNEALSRAQLDAKKELTLHRSQMMQTVLEDVRAKLSEFQRGATYYPWLLATARAAIEQAGKGELALWLGSADALHARQLEADCGVPVRLASGEADFFGGVRVVNHTASTICSDTFDDRLMQQKTEFLRLCGITTT